MLPIYLDNHATTPVDPRVLEAMLPYYRDLFGNASSKTHVYGWKAKEAVEAARAQVGRLLDAPARDIIFTSGATESNNLAISGLAREAPGERDHIVTSRIEHPAVLEPIGELEKQGFEVTYLVPDRDGLVSASQVEAAMSGRTLLVSLMAANNEIGTLCPLGEIGEICARYGAIFHTDAAQAVGKVPVSVREQGIDLLSLSAHKVYGPKGVGALYVRGRDPRVRLSPSASGGGQERGLRPGTLNVPGIVGLGQACELARKEMPAEAERLLNLRSRLEAELTSRLGGVTVNGHPDLRLPGNLNVSFSGVPGESLVLGLKEIAVSSGSACSSEVPRASHVLLAMGVSPGLAHASIRFGLGRFNTERDVDVALEATVRTVTQLRELSRSVTGRAAGPPPGGFDPKKTSPTS